MGRFDALELNETPKNISPVKTSFGEAIKDAQFFLDSADKHFFRMEYEEALKDYSSAASTDPGAVPAWRGQAFCLAQLSEFREAEVWVKKAIEIVGENADFLALLALIYGRKGDFDRACGYSDSSLESSGSSPLPYIVRGELFLYGRRNGEYCFERACTLDSGSWQTRYLIADGCLFSGKKAGAAIAMKYLQPALATDSHRVELQLQKARILTAQHHYADAREVLSGIKAVDNSISCLASLEKQAEKRGFFSWF